MARYVWSWITAFTRLDQSTLLCRISESYQSRSEFLHVRILLLLQPQCREIAYVDLFGPDEEASILLALEIPLPVHAAVVLAKGLVERDANPRRFGVSW